MTIKELKGALHSRKTPRKLINGGRIKLILYKTYSFNTYKRRIESTLISPFIPYSKYN